MKLLCSPPSPYSSKVRMAAHYIDADLQEVHVDTAASSPSLVDRNPLGKIPTLIAEDGTSIFDSVTIMHYLDRIKGAQLYPLKKSKRLKAEILESLCDGVCDCLLAIMYEKRFHPEDKIHQPWIDRQWAKVINALIYLNANPPKIGKKLHGGHFALAALLGYLDLRFKGQWETECSQLLKWLSKFEKAFPAYKKLKPQG